MASKSRLGPSGHGVRRKGSFAGKTADAGIIADPFRSTEVVSDGIKKPGIPSGTPEWLKTMLETVIGRRGNAIDIPPAQNLTFSASPTQEECEALYDYINSVQAAVEQILNRLDG